MRLVSSCLAGVTCRYDGAARPDADVVADVDAGRALPLCAEVLGGDGHDVLDGTARVLAVDGTDSTDEFVLQARSPSCGCGRIYSGAHDGTLVDGDGIVAAALQRSGIRVSARRGRPAPRS